MVKKITCILFFASTTCSAIELTSYNDTVEALKNGKSIKYVVDWDLCKVNIPNIKPNFLSSYTPDNVNIDKSGLIQSAGVKYAHKVAAFPQIEPVLQSYVYTFTKDNVLRAINYFLDPVTYKEKMPPFVATCQLGASFKVFAKE